MKETPIELLKKLISKKSITPEHDGSIDILSDILSSNGYSTKRYDSNGVANLWAYNSPNPKLLFAGHVDVVPPGDSDLWDSDPFIAKEKDGFIYGRGACDMKSALCAMIDASCRLSKVPGVCLIITSDEEGPALHGTKHVVNELKKLDVKIPYAIVGEPTCESKFGDAIKIGRRGSITARFTIFGTQGHVAYPEKADNPVPKLINALSAILKSNIVNPIGKNLNFNAETTFLKTGVAENVIPSKVNASVNFRYSDENGHLTIKELTEKFLEEHAPGMWECEWFHQASPYCFEKESVLVSTLTDSVFEVCGVKPKPSTAGGASDGRFLREICGEICEFGVINETIHSPNEKVHTDEVNKLCDVYFELGNKILKN